MNNWLILFLFFIPINIHAQTDPFEYKEYLPRPNDTLRYRILSPETKIVTKKYPLVLFFHGAGERGYDNKKQLEIGVRILANKENRTQYPCYIVAPQCPMKTRWVNTEFTADSSTMAPEPTKPLRLSIELLPELIQNYPIDTNRIYVMGLSMGGFATWELLARLPKTFAAAAPVSGGGDEKQVSKFIQVPIWAFHGEQDKLVKPHRSTNMIKALKKAGGSPKYTGYKDVGHNCWGQTFNDKELYKWLFAQKKH